MERQDGTAEVGTGACNCAVCGRVGRKCPAHRRMRCARAAQSIVAGAGGSGCRVGDWLAGGSEAVAGGLVSSVRHVV